MQCIYTHVVLNPDLHLMVKIDYFCNYWKFYCFFRVNKPLQILILCVYKCSLNLVFTVPADVLAPNGFRQSAETMLTEKLTHCGLVTPYGDRDLGQHCQVMACCLTAPSHYLNQCWLIISEVHQKPVWKYVHKISLKFSRGQWVIHTGFKISPAIIDSISIV